MPETGAEPEAQAPCLSVADVRALDAAAITEYAIPGILLMEHAALGVVGVIETLCPSLAGLSVVIGCGQGNNGGDGWAVARLLHHRGVSVTVVPLGEPAPGSDAAINATIARRMGIPEQSIGESWGTPALVVDALFGTGLSRPPTGDAALFIARCNAAECPVVAFPMLIMVNFAAKSARFMRVE